MESGRSYSASIERDEMPIYLHRCSRCNEESELLLAMRSMDAPQSCLVCGAPLVRIPALPANAVCVEPMRSKIGSIIGMGINEPRTQAGMIKGMSQRSAPQGQYRPINGARA